MKKILACAALVVSTFTSVFAATPEKYFKYDLCGEEILSCLNLKGDYICITEVDNDKLDQDKVTTLELPSEIEGIKCVALCGSISYGSIGELLIGNTVKKMVIPETYEVLNFSAGNESMVTEFTGKTDRPLYFGVQLNKNYIKGHSYINGGLPQANRTVYFPNGGLGNNIVKIEGIEKLNVSKNWVFYRDGDDNPEIDSSSLKELVFEEGSKLVCTWDCRNLQKVTFAKSIKEIVADAFSNKSNLTEVVIPAGAVYKYPMNLNLGYGSYAFSGCSSLGLRTKSAIKATGYTDSF